ncbi:MAG: MFS transporter [Alphaproteobacteria bacterium]|nr:MFS transporter [Alphaproteobacteria bacterium]
MPLPKLSSGFFSHIVSALTNNLFRITLLTMIAVRITQQTDDPYNVVAGMLILPFFLFSARATQLAKKYNRTRTSLSLNLTELALMLLAGSVLLTKNIGLLILLPFLYGALSAFLGPMRYAFQPDQLEESDLTAGDAYIEKTTYFSIAVALLFGTLLPVRLAAAILIVCSVVGFFVTWRSSPDAAAAEPEEKSASNSPKAMLIGIWKTLKTVRKYPLIFRSILGTTWFWSIGLLMIMQVYPLTEHVFHADDFAVAFQLLLFAAGAGVGAMYCHRLLKGVAHTTFVPISTIGMGICFMMLFFLTAEYAAPVHTATFTEFVLRPRVVFFSLFLFLLGFSCGMYVIPLTALIRSKASDANRATVFAAGNLINAAGIALMALIFIAARHAGLSIAALFLLAGAASFVVSVYNCSVLPAALLRSIVQAVLEFFYRVTVKGLPNFQAAGKRVLIVANHASLLDGLLIAAFMPEKITFVIKPEWENKWFAKLFSLMIDLYPLDLNNPMSVRPLVDLIKKNNKVMIFPERRISVTGALMKVYEGAGLVAEKANANILPVRINGAQYSKFSLLKDRVKTRYFPKIIMNILPPRKFDIDPTWTSRQRNHEISNQLYDMMTDMMYESSKVNENLFVSLLNAAKINGKNHIIAEDVSRKPIKYKTLLLKSYVLGAAMERCFEDEERLGLLLPNVLANVVSFFALQSIDKVPAMLNFSTGVAQVVSCVKTVQLKTVLTSKKFIENAHLEKLEEALKENGIRVVYLEDFASEVLFEDKLRGILAYLTSKKPKNSPDHTAAIMFTSGSEGMPKAVLLSHKNFQANRYQALSVIAITSADVFFNALPMFHAFGLGVGTILTLLSGIRTFFYPSPLHYRIVPELVYETNATVLCGTDTFFAGYGAMAHPYDFFALRYAIVGAEKLKPSTSELWMRKFGIRILEGYGATETAPVISLNTPMYIREGSVGRLLPKMVAKLEEVPGIKEGAKLLVSGDNVMQGYMKADNPGVLIPPKEGWHDTGDIVTIDKDGFVFIQGRAKRFAKIGGEMVSLTAVEQLLSKLYPDAVQGLVSVPDPKKGEKLVLITTKQDTDLSEIRAYIKEQGFNELGSPSKFIYVKEPPVLGSGKFDYVTAEKMAAEQEA